MTRRLVPSHAVPAGRLYRDGRISYNVRLQDPDGLGPPGRFPDMDAFLSFLDTHGPFNDMGAFTTNREGDMPEVSGFCRVAS